MRPRLRAAGFLALAVVAITCTDAPTSPRDGRGGAMSARHLSMSPSFSPAAAKVYNNLAAFGILVTEVHVHLTAPDGTARDTTINFPVGQDTLVIEIPVDAAGTDQTFTALLELRNADHTVLFSGTQTVVARSFSLEAPAIIAIRWTGPGSRTKTVAVSPADSSVGASATVPMGATAVDSSGGAVTDLVVRWTTSDSTIATVKSTGNSTGSVVGQGRRGIATVSAITPSGIIGTARVSFVPPPARLVIVSGGGQTGVAGSLLASPFVVEVQATDNLPVAGATVAFRAVTAGGVVTTATAVSDAAGRVSTTLTLGKTGGTYQYEAASGALPAVPVTETATPAPPALVAIASGNSQVDSVGQVVTLPLVVKVTDQFGGASSGATVTWARVAGSGAVGAATSTSASDGLASTTYTLGNAVGSETISATVAGVSGAAGTTTFKVNAISRGAATIAVVSGGAQSGAPGVTLATPLVARVADVLNNPVANATVAWSTLSAGTTFTPASSVTDALGQVTTSAKLGTVAGPVVVSATTGALAATANLTIVAGPAAIIARQAGDAQTIEVATNVAIAPSAKVTDANGNVIAGAAVIFSVATGGGSVTAATTSTDATGVATVGSWKLGNTAGSNTLTASAGALTATFSATAKSGSAARLAFVAAPPASITVGAAIPAITARITDALDNSVASAGVIVTATGVTTPGGFTTTLAVATDAAGVATFALPPYVGPTGTATFTLTTPSLTPVASSAITIGAGTPAKLIIATQPSATAASGAALVVQPVLQLTDVGGNGANKAGVSVTAAIGSGGGTLGGTQTVTSSVAGLATFTDLAISGTAGARALVFTATGLTGVTSSTITLGAGAAAAMTKNTGDAQTATAGSAVAVPPSVLVKDAAGNPVAGAAVTFAVASGGGALTVPTTATNASGVATVGSWTLGNAAGANSLTATSGSFTATFTATGTSGSAAKLVFVTAAPASITVGLAIPAFTAQLTDALSNTVAAAGVTVTATGVITPGEFTAMYTATSDAAGLATFTLPVYAGPLGSVIFTITAPGLTSVASSPITLMAGAVAKLAIATQPSTTAASGAALGVQPVVQLRDAGNNNVSVAGVSVTAAIASGGGTLSGTQTVTSSVAGLATFTDLAISGTAGARTLVFTATGLTGATSSTITLGAGAAAAMTKNTGDAQTATASSPVAVPPSVLVKDGAGNPIAGAPVTFVVAGGGGSLIAPTTSTNASGLATVGSWTLGSLAGANSLTATSGVLTATFTATGIAGVAAKLVAASAPPVSVTVGAPIAPSTMLVQVADAGSNAVSTSVPITVTGTVAPSGTTFTTTVSSDASGLATFTLPTYVGPIGTLTLTATSGSLTALTSGAIPVLTGAPALLTIATQPPATVTSGAIFSVAPKVQVVDAGANPVSQGGLTVTATFASGSGTLSGASTTTNSGGLATFSAMSITGTVGPRTLGFASGSLVSPSSGTITVTAGAAASMNKSAGDAQTATVGSAVATAPQVRVLDASSNPVPGVSVTFGVTTGGGSVTGTNPATTDASGFASIGSWKLGTAAGANTMTATAGSLNAVFSATGAAGSLAGLRFASGVPASIAVGASFASPVTVQLIDADGNPVSTAGRSVGLNMTVIPSGTSVDFTATTDASGLATFTLSPYGGQVGTATLSATSSGLTSATSASIPVVAGSVSKLVIATQPSPTAANGVAFAVQPAVQLADVGGNAVSGSVNITALKGVAGSYTLGGTTIVATDASGLATFSILRFNGSAGVYSLRFIVSGGGPTSPLTNSITLTAGAGTALSIITQPSATATSGAILATQPVIQLTDASGNAVATAGVVVTASISTGNGSLASATATTVAGGAATFSGLAITGTAGAFILNFDAPSYSTIASGTITIGAGLAAKLLVTTGFSDGQSGVPFGTQPVVRVLDSGDNPVLQAGISIGVSIATGGGTLGGTTPVNTNASGVATFTDLVVTGAAGPRTFAFSGPSLPTINFGPITVSAGAASKLVFLTAPGSSATNAQAFPIQPTVQLEDAFDNPVALSGVVVGATFPGYPGSLTGAYATTDATGLATFSGLTITGPVGSYALTFGSGSYTVAVSGMIALAAGTPTQLAFTGQPSDAQTGLSIAPPVRVTIKDVSGNTVPLNSSPITLSLTLGTGNGSAILGGTNPKGTVGGVATFSDLTVSVSASGYSLTAASGVAGVSQAISAAFKVTAPGPSGIETVAGAQTAVLPRTTIPAGTIMFRVRDLANNPVPDVDVTLSGNRADCNFVTAAKSNATGIVSVAVATDSMTKGCTMIARASGVVLSASAQITTVPYAATHAWFGGTSGGPTEFDLAGNWVNIATKANDIPGAGTTPYVPFWPTLNFPVASKNKSVAGIFSDTGAYLDLAGNTLRTSASVHATVLGGMTTATGSGVTLRGQFDSLTAGVAGLCGSQIPEFVVADSLYVPGKVNVVCGLVAKALFTDGLVTSVPGAFVKIPAGGLLAADSVSFLGDSIVVDSSGTAALGDADIRGALRIYKGTLYVSRTSTFGGFGTVDSATVNLVGDATFTGTSDVAYRFSSGRTYLQGNFAQTATFGAAFVADPSHITYFIGGAKQSINFAAPGSNQFGSVVTNNVSGVNLLSSVNLASGAAAGNWWAYNGPVSVPVGVTLAVPGYVDFVTGGTMRVDGALTLALCFKDTTTSPFSGTGTVGDILPIEYSCTYISPGGNKLASGTASTMPRVVPPPVNRVNGPVVRKPVKVVRLRLRAR